jgi:dinuclear metal center YbgI/SA1388 family protein
VTVPQILNNQENSMAERDTLVQYCNELLESTRFRDYCPNGLQVEGRAEIVRLVTAVTASLQAIEAARDLQADALLVHHGYFWKGEDAVLVGMKRRRVEQLLDAGINLLAYHLPLDAHAELGNNAQLARVLNIQQPAALDPTGRASLVWLGQLPQAMPMAVLAEHVSTSLDRQPLVIDSGQNNLQRVAWCTGAAQNAIEQAAAVGADVYISGEVSEQTVHAARELGISYVAAGHHATERYGVQALGEHLAEQFQLECHYVELDNPV